MDFCGSGSGRTTNTNDCLENDPSCCLTSWRDKIIVRFAVRSERVVSRSLPLVSTVTITALPDMSRTPFAPFEPDVIEDKCGDDESKKDSNNAIADVIEIDIGVIDFVGPSSMAEILRYRLSELREFTKI